MLQLVGGALGLGVLVAVYGTAVGHSAPTPARGRDGGIGTAFGFAAILDVCSLLVIIALIRTGRLAPAVAPADRPKQEAVASLGITRRERPGTPRLSGTPVPRGTITAAPSHIRTAAGDQRERRRHQRGAGAAG